MQTAASSLNEPLKAKQLSACPVNTKLITVQLTSCLFCVDSAALLMLNEQQFYEFGQIQTSQTGDLQYSDTSP